MSVQDFQQVIIRRWWLILVAVLVAAGGALGYSGRQERIYRASATVFAHPSHVVSTPADINSDVGILTYGSLAETFASLAQSGRFLDEAGHDVGVQPAALDHYTTSATTLPSTTVLQVSVDGPDARLAAKLADALVTRVAAATTQYFRTFALTPLDSAVTPKDPIQPVPSHDVLYAGLAGLIVGFILAALSIYRPVTPAAKLGNADSVYMPHAHVARQEQNGVGVK
jgi:capsular polysaccharide biosynthesis protein